MTTIAALEAARTLPGATMRLTKSTVVTTVEGGHTIYAVSQSPAELASVMGESVHVCTLSRLLASEGYGRLGKGHLTAEARAAGETVAAVAQGQIALRAKGGIEGLHRALTMSTFAHNRGKYGSQGGRYASTRQDPTVWDVKVAKALLAGGLPNVSQDATQFLDPSGSFGPQTYEEVLASWTMRSRWIGPIPTLASGHFQAFAPHPDKAVRELSRGLALAAAHEDTPAPGDPSQLGGIGDDVMALIAVVGLVLALVVVLA